MMKRKPSLLAASLAAALAAAGCSAGTTGDGELLPISAQSAALTANSVIALHLDDLAAALKTMEGSKLVERVFPRSQIATPCPPPVDPSLPPPNCDVAAPTSALDTTDDMDAMKKALAEQVFSEANVEAGAPGADATHVVFRLRPQTSCPKSVDENGTESIDAECAKTLTDVPVRFTVSSRTVGDVDVSLAVGAAHPAEIGLHSGAVTVDVALAEAKAALKSLADAGDESYEAPDLLEGRFRLAVTRNAAKDYSAAFSIVEAVRLADKAETDPEHVALTLAPANDVLSLRVKGGERTALAALNLGAVDLTAALDQFWSRNSTENCVYPEDPSLPPECTTTPAQKRTGTIRAHLAGLEVTGDMNAASDALTLTGLGLGDETSWVKFGTQTLFALDLNSALGRHFDLSMTDAEAGGSVTLTPGVTLHLSHDLRSIANQADEGEIPDWMMQGTVDLSLTGAGSATLAEVKSPEAAPCDDVGNCPEPAPARFAKVSLGTLVLSASGATPVTVGSGQCLVEAPEGDHDHPIESFAAGACE